VQRGVGQGPSSEGEKRKGEGGTRSWEPRSRVGNEKKGKLRKNELVWGFTSENQQTTKEIGEVTKRKKGMNSSGGAAQAKKTYGPKKVQPGS